MDRSRIGLLLNEVMRRKVARVAVGYAVVVWLLLQIAEVTFEPLRLPDWALTLLVVLAVAGFAVAVVLAWAIEVTPEGLRRDPQDQPKNNSINSTLTANGNEYRSVAVLPFVDMSPNGDQRYFCDGIAEEIISALSTIRFLRVPARTSTFRFNTGDHDIREIGEALDVETILEGSVRRDEDRIRITAELIDAHNGYHIWAKSYDRKLRGIFEVQQELSRDIVRQLCESLDPEEIVIPEPDSIADIEAYDYYLQGRYYMNLHTEQSAKFAIQMFEKATVIAPEMSMAWAGLSEAYTFVYINYASSDDHKAFAREAAEKAIGLSPDSVAARTALGMALMIDGKYADADVEFSTALRTHPQCFCSLYYFARSCLLQGKLEQAAELFERASQSRPEDYQAPLLVLSVYRRLGRQSDAREAARRGIKAAECHLALHPDDARALYLGCRGFLELGQLEKGRRWAERAIAMNQTDSLARYNVACFYALAGEIDLAFEHLSKVGIDRQEFYDWMAIDPDLDPLHGDPRFESLCHAARSADVAGDAVAQ